MIAADNATLAALAGATALFLLDLALTVALEAVGGLSLVGLHRLRTESEGRLDCVEQMGKPMSTHRAAVVALRQFSLIAATLLLALAAGSLGWSYPLAVALGASALGGVLLLEGTLARAVAIWAPRTSLRVTAPLIRAAHALLYVAFLPLSYLERRIDRSTQLNDERPQEGQDDDAEALIEVGEREGILEADESAMMRSIVDLDDKCVREIMTPRIDIVALPVDATVAQARRAFVDAGHSRIPVYRGSIDGVTGVLHARDLLRAWQDAEVDQPISRYLRPAIHVPETLSVAALLGEMRLKTHIAMVVDEYGGVAGLVTLEDVLEEIVGEIRDEHEVDEEVQPPRRESDGSYTIPATTHVDELERLFPVRFDDRDFDTVGGLVVSGFGRVPGVGERLEVRGLVIEVLEADERRIRRVRVRALAAPGEARAGQ